MEFYAINLLYFIIVIPIILIAYPILSRLCKEDRHLLIIIALSLLLFSVRFVLIFFQETIGIMPYLVEDIVFYSLLMVFGVVITLFFTFKIENTTLEEIGGKVEDVKKSIFYGLIGLIPLLLLLPLIVMLADIQISFDITPGKISVAISFTVLAAVYEEIMFRGIIQNHINELNNEKDAQTILFTAVVFTVTHLFYLPFIGFGIFYIFVFIMALLLSLLRIKADLLACAILHGGIVFILIIFV